MKTQKTKKETDKLQQSSPADNDVFISCIVSLNSKILLQVL
ncbi:hypothetical protein [Methanobrevibacter sp. V74]|nr:hypothetical protein [Methanobrevibacter sp. V74]